MNKEQMACELGRLLELADCEAVAEKPGPTTWDLTASWDMSRSRVQTILSAWGKKGWVVGVPIIEISALTKQKSRSWSYIVTKEGQEHIRDLSRGER